MSAESGGPGLTGIYLERLTWQQAEEALKPDTIVVLPLGAALKEHGPHLLLMNDRLIADYLAEELRKRKNVVLAPTIAYSYYPAFTEYPGSTTLTVETASNMLVEICLSLNAFGPNRFYVLNTGVSTTKPIEKARQDLASKGVILSFTDFKKAMESASRDLMQQDGGGHADEIETSLMLHIAPTTVALERATCDFGGNAPGGLTRDKARADSGHGVYSPTGSWGDPTLATADKGKQIAAALIDWIVKDIDTMENTLRQ